MTPVADNGHKTETAIIPEQKPVEGSQPPTPTPSSPYVPLKKKRNPLKENATLLVLAAAIVILLITFAIQSLSKLGSGTQTTKKHEKQPNSTYSSKTDIAAETPARSQSVLPTTETPHPAQQDNDLSQVGPEQIARTAKFRPAPTEAAKAGTLGAIPPFDGSPWQPVPYLPSAATTVPVVAQNPPPTSNKSEREELDKSSIIFVRNNSQATVKESFPNDIEIGLGMPPGTRLRARLESAINSSVQTPVVAVVEYNYEQEGEIVVPAGAKAFGHLQSADRSGYVGIRFDSLLMPDGSTVKFEATATDLQLAPLKGKVTGKNTGKNVIVRSLSGLGQVAATIVGQGSFNQPLNEQDLVRERIATNIGQTSDEQVASMAITERIVISIPASTEIYVVLEKPAQANAAGRTVLDAQSVSKAPNIEELRQLLQLQRELNTTTTSPNQ